LVVAAATVVSGGAQAKTSAPTVSVSAPKGSLTNGTHYDIGASGYSGGFNRVAIFVSVNTPCAATALGEARTGTPEHLFRVAKYRSFALATRNAYWAKAPGDRYACAYLFLHNHSDASDQLRAERHFRVVRKR